ncbi:glycosyltransferase [Endozoicomonas sp. Mp262]|uniref:glycosyltransferase family 2 protein n=1 Tax=Endozoicomonas sp. Mp262 TaxID=2919499 RepID=UPI0021DB3812
MVKKTMKNPKISIVTAVYNNINTIASSIDSTLSQTYKNIELVVIDGGSTDGTLELLKGYGKKIHTLISEPDKGIYDALNKGVKHATGDIVGFMHSDDLFQDKNSLKRVAKAFQKNKVDSVYGDLVYVNKEDTSLKWL